MINNKILIAIPARYASNRLPGKPLVKLLGKEMLLRVFENAQKLLPKYPKGYIDIAVATEDKRILDFCKINNIKAILTSEKCKTGTDRCKELMQKLEGEYSLVVNLQGDNPLCPPWHIKELIDVFINDNSIDVVTPCVNLSWTALDKLRENKKETPFSGTTAIINPENNNAIWFSKNIIPAIRKEEKLRDKSNLSPVWRHIGLYAYKSEVLKNISNLNETEYEKPELEGLEQLRFILNGYKVRIAKVNYNNYEEIASASGVDNIEDIARIEKLIEKYGDFNW